MKKICFAGGCFWGVEEYFSRIAGVVNTTVGYANGEVDAPTYEEVCKGYTGHAEAVSIEYDEAKVSLEKLLEKFWAIIDPTVIDRQGPDVGNQYRTGIFYSDGDDFAVIKESLDSEQNKYSLSIVTKVEELRNFFDAEEYHQDYLKKNPTGYCHIPLD